MKSPLDAPEESPEPSVLMNRSTRRRGRVCPAPLFLQPPTRTPTPAPEVRDAELIVEVVPARYIRLELGNLITGYTVKAMYRKIQESVWREEREWIRAPDGHILLDRLGYERWAASNYAPHRPQRR